MDARIRGNSWSFRHEWKERRHSTHWFEMLQFIELVHNVFAHMSCPSIGLLVEGRTDRFWIKAQYKLDSISDFAIMKLHTALVVADQRRPYIDLTDTDCFC
jgi:hypothetical protein